VAFQGITKGVHLQIRFLILAAAVVATAPALAVESGAIDKGVSLTVTDLDPVDGIAAALNDDPSTWQGPSATTPDEVYWWHLDSNRGTSPQFGIGDYQAWADSSSVHGKTTGEGQYYHSYALVSGDQLEITPHTRVTINFAYDLFGTPTNALDHGYPVVSSTAHLYFGAACPGGPQGYQPCPSGEIFSEADAYFSPSILAGADGFAHQTGSVSVTFTNASDDYDRFIYGAELSTDGSSIAPVPEPSTIALMFAGLLGVGTFTRRRQT
jgi:hypothetical protein